MDKITVIPTGVGQFGKFWEVDWPKFMAANPNPDDATVACILVEAPYAHGMWHSYMLAMVHLRPFPGCSRPPHINRPGATHELMVFALDPQHPREAFIKGEDHPRVLTPANFVGQIIEPSDGMARDTLRKAAEDIVDGKLNPDTDYIRQWAARFGAYCLKPGWDAGPALIIDGQRIDITPEDAKAIPVAEGAPAREKIGEAKDEADFVARFHANQKFEGIGAETAVIYPCGYCGAPDLMRVPVVSTEEAICKGGVCWNCDRGIRATVERTDQGATFHFLQTCGPDQPEWMRNKIPRAPSAN